MVYRKIDSCTPQAIEKIKEMSGKDGDPRIFWRFHDPDRRMSRRSKSWGMIYSSAAEAIADGSDVLNGKSCADTPEELMRWKSCYDEDYVVVAFYGYDTGEIGHDGETVAEYIKKVATFRYTDFVNCFEYKQISFGQHGWVLKEEGGYPYVA